MTAAAGSSPLEDGMAARDPRVREHAGSLYFCFSR